MSSGPEPQTSESTQTVSANGNDAEDRNQGAVDTRASGTTAGNGDGRVTDSGQTKPNVSVAGHTYDKGYSKWAKFDVDAALRSVDQGDAEMDEKVGNVGRLPMVITVVDGKAVGMTEWFGKGQGVSAEVTSNATRIPSAVGRSRHGNTFMCVTEPLPCYVTSHRNYNAETPGQQ